MPPPEGELLSDHDLREATIEQLLDLPNRVDSTLQMRAGREEKGTTPEDRSGRPLPGEGPERPATD